MGGGGEEENNNNTNSFLQLTSLTLEDLQSLKSFFTYRSETQSLFTSPVTFPALETLDIDGLTMITEIWDRKLLPSDSFRQLRDVTIGSCEKLVNVGSSNMPRQLPKLERLDVSHCRELKVIVLKNGGEEEEKAENNNITNSFLQLTSLTLEDLQSLKSFFTYRSETQSLFTSQVTFPALETLDIDGLTMITEIWDRKLLLSDCFRQLRDVTIGSCEKLSLSSFFTSGSETQSLFTSQ
ncbi:uncharacterized protein LOC114303385, partial [Camellia sinensis]|uniref:uncharacterized protein LOC114303385 n=1 Tax=Camellia sinensis TaxID=4442 RepID=UPI001036482D